MLSFPSAKIVKSCIVCWYISGYTIPPYCSIHTPLNHTITSNRHNRHRPTLQSTIVQHRFTFQPNQTAGSNYTKFNQNKALVKMPSPTPIRAIFRTFARNMVEPHPFARNPVTMTPHSWRAGDLMKKQLRTSAV
jgi:hypothetical protein